MQSAWPVLCSTIMANLLDQCPLVREMLETKMAYTPAGNRIPMISNISQTFAEALYGVVLKNRPVISLEVGMAFGISSLAILTALRDAGQRGKLITIDPHQTNDWSQCGRT